MSQSEPDNTELFAPDDYTAIARIHINNLDKSFLASLGDGFLALMYRCIDESHNSDLLVRRVNGKVVGFVTGTVGFGEIYRIMLKKYSFQLSMCLLPALFSPRKLLRIFEILVYSHKHGNESAHLPAAELLSIAVDKDFRGKKLPMTFIGSCALFLKKEKSALSK
jgi:ribosomal protein S18 acetylase RimI-like enzyme